MVSMGTAQTMCLPWWLELAFNEMLFRWEFEPFPSGRHPITCPEMNGQDLDFEVVSSELPCTCMPSVC